MGKRVRYSEEVKKRAIRLVYEAIKDHGSQWAATKSIATKIGCTPESLRRWIQQSEVDSGTRNGMTSDERTRIKELEREVRELKRANDILRKASAYFAQAELDRPLKK
jgi:transposase